MPNEKEPTCPDTRALAGCCLRNRGIAPALPNTDPGIADRYAGSAHSDANQRGNPSAKRSTHLTPRQHAYIDHRTGYPARR